MRNLRFIVGLGSLLMVGCAGLRGGLRQDLNSDQTVNNQPTRGGVWAERGLLSDDGSDKNYSGSVGHSERSPASAQRAADGSWISDEQDASNQRDARRGTGGEDPSYADNPNMPPQTKRQYKNGSRATAADFVDESTSEGSLWASDGQTNYYFTKNKVRGVGDIVTVVTDADFFKDIGNEISRTLSPDEKDVEVDAAQNRIRAKALGLPDPDGGTDSVTKTSAAPKAAPAKGQDANADSATPDIRKATMADIDVTKSIGVKAGDPVMCEITERYPNGNYKIRGSKKVPYRGSYRWVNVLAIVRGSDIAEDDTIPSGKLYEYKLEAQR